MKRKNNPTKADLICNFKWLNRLKKFSEIIEGDGGSQIHLILLTRHLGFREEFRSSKRKFKKISAEHLNNTKNYCLNTCIQPETIKKVRVDYIVLFINYRISPEQMIKNMNIMINSIVKNHHSTSNTIFKAYHKDQRELLRNKLTLCLSEAIDDEYMHNYTLKMEEKLDVL